MDHEKAYQVVTVVANICLSAAVIWAAFIIYNLVKMVIHG